MTETPPRTLTLSKFEAAERQLNQAIALFFEDGDSVSVHTLAEAAAQLLYDMRAQFNATSLFRDTDRIRDEYKAEWNRKSAESKNFFKHADRDPKVVHEFREDLNHFSLLEATNLYLAAKRAWTPESILFLGWFASTYPSAIKQDSMLSALLASLIANTAMLSENERLSMFHQALAEFRSSSRRIEGITLTPGLPNVA